MDYEKIKLALALKGLEIVVIRSGDALLYMGYLKYVETSRSGFGYYEDVVKNSAGNKVMRIGKSKDELAYKLYQWVIANGSTIKEAE